jgi:hypothetical protein
MQRQHFQCNIFKFEWLHPQPYRKKEKEKQYNTLNML